MRKQLEPFQSEGVFFLFSRYHAALGDQPGLGKTLQAIDASQAVNAKHVLVVCPASVRTNWYEQVEDRLGHTRGWDIISYNGATDPNRRQFCLRDKYDLWIGDEIHNCKSTESQRSLAVFGKDGVARRARYKWVLSGTLAPNGRPVELYPLLKTLCPRFAGYSFAQYTQEFCGAFWDGRERNVKGATQVEKLASMMEGFLLRRTKKQVYPNRKAPIVERIPVDLTGQELREVHAAEDEAGGREARISSSYEKASQMGDTSRLLRLLGAAIVNRVADFVCDQLESVEKVVVFAHHIEVIDLLFARFSESGYSPVAYRGGMSDGKKDTAIGKFMRDPACRVFIGQDQAAGEGINGLQRVCSTVVDAEPSWVPGATEQRISRLDRMGLEDDVVNYYLMYAKDTLSAIVVGVHDRKERTAEKMMGDVV